MLVVWLLDANPALKENRLVKQASNSPSRFLSEPAGVRAQEIESCSSWFCPVASAHRTGPTFPEFT